MTSGWRYAVTVLSVAIALIACRPSFEDEVVERYCESVVGGAPVYYELVIREAIDDGKFRRHVAEKDAVVRYIRERNPSVVTQEDTERVQRLCGDLLEAR